MNITLICTGKPKSSCDSHYWDTCFTPMVWNRTCNISEVCLYPSPPDPAVLATNRQLDLAHNLKAGNHEARSSVFKVMSNPRPGHNKGSRRSPTDSESGGLSFRTVCFGGLVWLEGEEPKKARGEIGAGRSFVKGSVIVQTYCQGQ